MKRSLSPDSLYLIWQIGWAVAGASLLWRSRRALGREPDGRTGWTGEGFAVVVYFAVYAAAWLVAIGLAGGLARELSGSDDAMRRALFTLFNPALMAMVLLGMRRFTPEISPQRPHRVKPPGDFGFTPGGLVRGFSGAMFMVSLSALLWSGLLWLAHKAGAPDYAKAQDSVAFIARARDWRIIVPFLLGAVAFAPVHEELFYRNGLFAFLRAQLPRYAAYAACGAIFGAIHLSVFAFLPLAVFGAWLAWLYDTTADLRVPIVVHALFNLSTVTWAVLAPGAVA